MQWFQTRLHPSNSRHRHIFSAGYTGGSKGCVRKRFLKATQNVRESRPPERLPPSLKRPHPPVKVVVSMVYGAVTVIISSLTCQWMAFTLSAVMVENVDGEHDSKSAGILMCQYTHFRVVAARRL